MTMKRLVPMLPVKSMPASVEFYQKLGFIVEQRNDHWGWAMLCFDECRLMVDQSINLHRDAPRQSVLYLYPENIVEYHQQVRRNGLAVPDLDVTFYGISGRSVIVIEHHQAVMAHADWIIDLGPGAGHDGGRIVFEGTPADLVADGSTLTGEHLAAYAGA